MTDRTISQELIAAGKPTVSQSEVDAFLRCDRNHFYGYGMNLQRNTESDSLVRGKTGHEALENYYTVLLNGGSVEDARAACTNFMVSQFVIYPERSVLLSEIIETLGFFFADDPFIGWEILAVEQAYVLKITEDLSFPFVIDLVVKDLYGAIWIVDHKFIYDFISDRDAELMPQLPKYLGALRALGMRVDKIAFNQLRYRTQKNMNVDNKHRFTEVPFTETAVKRLFLEQAVTADRIQAIKQQPLPVWHETAIRTANKMVCNNCSYRSLCVAELNDHSPQLVLDSEYQVRTRREFAAAKSDALTEYKQIEAD